MGYMTEGDVVMGGKPSKGTRKDKRLSSSKSKKKKRRNKAIQKFTFGSRY